MRFEQAPQRRDVVCAVGGQPCGEVVELEQLDVEVAHGPGDLLQLLEAVAEDAQRLGREDPRELALQRPRAAYRDAQVVQELAVDVGERPRQVGVDDLVQAPQHRDGGDVGAHPGAQLHAQLRRSPSDTAAGRVDRVVLHRPRRLDEPELPGEQRQDTVVVGVVAEHAGDVQARAQGRLPAPPPRACGSSTRSRTTILPSSSSTLTGSIRLRTRAIGVRARISISGASRSRSAPAARSVASSRCAAPSWSAPTSSAYVSASVSASRRPPSTSASPA